MTACPAKNVIDVGLASDPVLWIPGQHHETGYVTSVKAQTAKNIFCRRTRSVPQCGASGG